MSRVFFLRLGLVLAAAFPASAATWRQLDTDAGRYETSLSGWTLTVDTTRARLVSALPPGGSETDNVLLAGGHRVWLGPQSEWPVFWPPPREWENSPAASVTLSADATELTLALPHSDLSRPALVRRYRLVQDALLLVAAWRATPFRSGEPAPSFQAVQILQTRADTAVYLAPRATPAAPLGHGLLALAVRPGTILDAPIPAGFATPARDSAANTEQPGLLRLAGTGAEEKIGMPPQPLVARFAGGHGLRLLPALHDGVVDPAAPPPEAGLFTQAYFGASAWAMVELEQLSPRLHARAPGAWVETVVRLEFIPPPSSP